MTNKKSSRIKNMAAITNVAFSALYLGAYLLGKSTRSISALRNAVFLARNVKKL